MNCQTDWLIVYFGNMQKLDVVIFCTCSLWHCHEMSQYNWHWSHTYHTFLRVDIFFSCVFTILICCSVMAVSWPIWDKIFTVPWNNVLYVNWWDHRNNTRNITARKLLLDSVMLNKYFLLNLRVCILLGGKLSWASRSLCQAYWLVQGYELPPSTMNNCCHVIVVKAVTWPRRTNQLAQRSKRDAKACHQAKQRLWKVIKIFI